MGGELRANATLGKSNFKDEDHFRRPGVVTDVVGKSTNLNGEVGLNYTRPLNQQLSMELVGLQKLGMSDFVSRFEENASRSSFESEAKSGESIGRGVLRLKRSDTLSFEAGAEAAFNFRDGQTGLTINGQTIDLPASNVRVEVVRGTIASVIRPEAANDATK